ncbi:MAG: hypothetical protein ABSF99_08600 [Anaerolineales bacterium]|jgi:hypothetical protein
MSDGYSRSPKTLKGALIEFSQRFIGPLPNVIIFQYNPEQLTRTLASYAMPGEGTSSDQGSPDGQSGTPANAQPDDPTETFSLKLDLDATDSLENGNPVAVVSGVAGRLAALEMLLYPQEDQQSDLRSSVPGSLSGADSSSTDQSRAVRNTVPIVLFVWGPGRILPVRLTSFSVEELFYSPSLYPMHARTTVGLRVLTATELETEAFHDLPGKDIALAAYKYSRAQKKVLAASNIANSVESILGMLPF